MHPAEHGDRAGLNDVGLELVVEVGGRNVEHHQLDAEGGRVLDGHHVGHVVAESGAQAGLGVHVLLALARELRDVALSWLVLVVWERYMCVRDYNGGSVWWSAPYPQQVKPYQKAPFNAPAGCLCRARRRARPR